ATRCCHQLGLRDGTYAMKVVDTVIQSKGATDLVKEVHPCSIIPICYLFLTMP
uniref:Uncharacterized protein n=1 Tax=Aegilops tauschii subsp. strangulata TaxID=200361 RepID=A0A453HLL8_AEGTS